MPKSRTESIINPNQSLQGYYSSFESRIGYWLVLGGTRHFGYWPKDTLWPFPIGRALRAMEDNLFDRLHLAKGSLVLDAGCGVGHVAIHMARRGLRIACIDVVDRHISQARRNCHASGFEKSITVQKMDYHHLDGFADNSFDGAYTMETFVHATDPEVALSEFFRVLKPGGSIALYEYDHINRKAASEDVRKTLEQIDQHAAMPSNTRFEQGVLERMMREAGFEDVEINDLSTNITPMLRLFFILAYIPALFVKSFGLEHLFINTITAVTLYNVRGYCRYVAISARKPLVSDRTDGLRERIR